MSYMVPDGPPIVENQYSEDDFDASGAEAGKEPSLEFDVDAGLAVGGLPISAAVSVIA